MNKEKIEKRDKNIKILEKWLLIGLVLFIVVQVGAGMIIHSMVPEGNKDTYEKYDKDYIGHWYDGTFFINMTVKENFDSMETYDKMKEDYNSNPTIKIIHTINYIAYIPFILICYVIYKDYKRQILKSKAPLILTVIGFLILFCDLLVEVDYHIDAHLFGDYGTGLVKGATYYPMIPQNYVFVGLLIGLGLLFMNMQNKKNKKPTKRIENSIKVLLGIIILTASSFILIRFGIRVYELIMNLIGNQVNIRIPFYYFIFELPFEYAKSNGSYLKIVIVRFIKDLPVFIASTISVYLFVKIMLLYSKNKINSKKIDKYYKIIFVSLIVSSIILNLVGLYEVSIFNNEFLYQFKEAKYTIAIRCLSEPILAAIFIYSFKHYVEKIYYLEYKED